MHIVVNEVVTTSYLGLGDDGDVELGAAAKAVKLEPIPEGKEVSAVLTDPQFQALRRAMTKAGVKPKVLAKKAVESGNEIGLRVDGELKSITPTPADDVTSNVALKLQNEKAFVSTVLFGRLL